VAAGCSEDDSVEVEEGEITATKIILNPVSAEPGDTIIATVVVGGDGTFPSAAWESVGGRFIVDNLLSVGWIAPTNSGIYKLSCTVTNSVGSVSLSANIFVGRPSVVVAEDAGEIHVLPNQEGDFYYLHNQNTSSNDFYGFSTVYSFMGGSEAPVVTDDDSEAIQYEFSANLTYAVNATKTYPGYSESEVDVWLVDLVNKTETRIALGVEFTEVLRSSKYQYPSISPDADLVAYQGFRPDTTETSNDTVDVYIYDVSDGTTTNVTESDSTTGRRRVNIYPTFSSDFNWLVFVSDRDAISNWELYGLPIANGVVATQVESVVRLTEGSLLGAGAWSGVADPLMAWNPDRTRPILAIVGADGTLKFVQTNAIGATVSPVPELVGTILGIHWSNDGEELAVSILTTEIAGVTGRINALYTVSYDGSVTLRTVAEKDSDRIQDMAWSPDDAFIVNRLTRSDRSWFQLIDIDAGTDLTEPLGISAKRKVGDRHVYAGLMSTNARYYEKSDSVFVYMLHFNRDTPSISTLNLSGVTR